MFGAKSNDTSSEASHFLIGESTFSLGSLLAAKAQKLTLDVQKLGTTTSNGQFEIRGESLYDSKHIVQVKLSVANIPKSFFILSPNSFLTISRYVSPLYWFV